MQSEAEQNGSVLSLEGDLTPLHVAMVASMEKLHEEVKEDRKLLAQLVGSLMKMQEDARTDREKMAQTLDALVAGLTLPEFPEVNVHVPAPEVTVNVPEAQVEITVPTPEVNVRVDAPTTRREVTFERDPLTQMIASAKVVESDGR